MTVTFQLGTSSVDAITILPEYSSTFGEKQLRSEIRTQNGRAYIYKWGDYDRIKLNLDFVSGANANTINDWWDSNTELLFFINSGEQNYEINYSEMFSGWNWSNVTRGAADTGYVKIVEDVTSGPHYIFRNYNDIKQNADLYFDVQFHVGSKDRVQVSISDGSVTPYARIYLDSGSYTNLNSDYIFYINVTSAAIAGFWRATMGYRYTDTTSVRSVIAIVNSDNNISYDGDGTSGIWAGDATLNFVGPETEVHSVFIANKTKPLNKYVRPYDNYLKGSITLEGY